MNQKTSIVNVLFPEQDAFYQQQCDQHDLSTNELTRSFERFSFCNNEHNKISAASDFCGETTNDSLAFLNRRQSTLHTSSRSLRSTHHHQQHHSRTSSLARPRFTSLSIRISSAATMNNPDGLQRSLSSSSKNNASATTTTDDQPRLASRLSTTRLPSIAPAGSHDRIASNNTTIDPIPSASNLLPLTTSTANSQPEQFVTMSKPTSTILYYVSASDYLAYNNLAEAD